MTRAGLSMALAMSTLTVQAGPPVPVYMTGAHLLRLAAFPAEALGKLSPDQQRDLVHAFHYMDGVHDASNGTAWCDNLPHMPKPDVVYWEGIEGLRKLPAEQLKRPAAHLLVEIWRKRWPCPAGAP